MYEFWTPDKSGVTDLGYGMDKPKIIVPDLMNLKLLGDEKMKKRNKHIGSSLEDSLKEEGILAETRAIALKEAVAWQVQKAMEKDKISKVEMARRMHTSRAALDRFLAPGSASVTLQTLTKAARAIGRDLNIDLI